MKIHLINNYIKLLILFLSTLPLMGQCKDIFIGDSLTYELAMSYQKHAPVDAKYLESTGLNSNKLLNWRDYIKDLKFEKYDVVYIVLGTNDLIESHEILEYKQKVREFILTIKMKNKNIVWLLPPALENKKNNILLNNARLSIIDVANVEGIQLYDMRIMLGYDFKEKNNNIYIRTKDGIHITKNGANMIIDQILYK